jgi:hypothetical protein
MNENFVNGEKIVRAFETFCHADLSPIRSVGSFMFNGVEIRQRYRKIVMPTVAEDHLGWLKCMESADGTYTWASLEVHASEEKASAPPGDTPDPGMIAVVWFEPAHYYYCEARIKTITYPSRIKEDGGAQNFIFTIAGFPFKM